MSYNRGYVFLDRTPGTFRASRPANPVVDRLERTEVEQEKDRMAIASHTLSRILTLNDYHSRSLPCAEKSDPHSRCSKYPRLRRVRICDSMGKNGRNWPFSDGTARGFRGVSPTAGFSMHYLLPQPLLSFHLLLLTRAPRGTAVYVRGSCCPGTIHGGLPQDLRSLPRRG